MTRDTTNIRRALLSVSDKTGLEELGRALALRGVEIVSTGGTAAALKGAGLPVTDVAELTGLPEMLDGRVKTLHPKVHGGLLAIRGNARHDRETSEHGIAPIDLLVVNLYPFEETAAQGADFLACVEKIDIGGPAMIRAAAKNHGGVAVVVDPADYPRLVDEMAAHEGATTLAFRRALAAKAFARTAAYDAAIGEWFAAQETGERAPAWRAFGGRLAQELRYGENPHQKAAFYRSGAGRAGVATAVQHQGKELSYNNLADTDAAFELAAEFDPRDAAAAAIVKHANPCGVAVAATLAEAYRKALACDPVSAFGGIVALNREIDADAAREIVEIFTEVVIAPGVTDEAKAIFAAKANLRLLIAGGLPDPGAGGVTVRSLSGGLLVQSRDNGRLDDAALRVATRREPAKEEWADLRFAWKAAKHVKSNAIVFARGGATVGIGAGQMSRVDSVRIAAWKAGEGQAFVVASDAFFPFADGLVAAAEAGATAVIQPGGSMRDEDVIRAADERGLAMVFTGMRHFRH